MSFLKQVLLSSISSNNDNQAPIDYQWPSVYEESREMLEASILVYAFADLRTLARQGVLSADDSQTLLDLPVTLRDVMRVISANMDTLKQAFGGGDADLYISSLKSIEERMKRLAVSVETGETSYETARLMVFDDENSSYQLVYGIAVDSARKRVTVAFRGSVTTRDFMTDAKEFLIDIPNPVDGGDQSRTIGVHHGFHDYLFGTKANDTQTKCELILSHLAALLEQNPGYHLYVTGHSLGGALSSLFAFEAAASNDARIPKPVSCVNIASPKVGSLGFQRAFQELENQRRLRCLRIANHKDLVTILPDRGTFSCVYIFFCQKHVYRHVGMELKLHRFTKHIVSYPSEPTGFLGQFCKDWTKQIKDSLYLIATLPCVCFCRENFLAWHSCDEYMARLQRASADLDRVYLNDWYNGKGNIHRI